MQDGVRYLGRETKARGPGMLAAIARSIGHGILALLRSLWKLTKRSGRELWSAFAVVGTQLKETRRNQPVQERPAPAPVPTQAAQQPAAAVTLNQPEAAWPPMADPVAGSEPASPAPEPQKPPKAKPTASDTPPSTLRTLDRTAGRWLALASD